MVLLAALAGTLAVAPSRRWVEVAARACHGLGAVPSVVLGLGAFLALSVVREWAAGASGWLTVGVALVLFTRSVTATAPALLASARDLVPDARQAALSLGAGPGKLVRWVYLPRLRGAVGLGVVLGTARTLTATSSVILLSDVQVPLLSVRILIDVTEGQVSTAAAATVVLGGLIGIVALLTRWGWGRG